MSADIGVWLVGARGNVATTAMIGARAIAHGVTDTTGMVTERAPCTDLDLPGIDSLVFGGHDIQDGSVVETAERLAERNGIPDRATLDAVRDVLRNANSLQFGYRTVVLTVRPEPGRHDVLRPRCRTTELSRMR